jgi:diguanylate cyclase (GGDEF)-like protein
MTAASRDTPLTRRPSAVDEAVDGPDAADRLRLQMALQAAEAALGAPDPDPIRGAERAREAGELARALGDRPAEAEALRFECMHEHRAGHDAPAIEAGVRAVRGFNELGRRLDAAEVRCTLSMAYNRVGLPGEALREATLALRVAEELADPRLHAWALNRCGIAHDHLGDLDSAVQLLEDAVELSRALPVGEDAAEDEVVFASLNNLAAALARRGEAHQTAGRRSECAEDGRRALQLAHEALGHAQGHPMREAASLGVASEASLLLRQHAVALASVRRSRRLAVQHGAADLELFADIDEALIRLRCGDPNRALELLDAIDPARVPPEHRAAWLRIDQARHQACKMLGRYEEALAALERVQAVERSLNQLRTDERVRVLRRDGELMQARQHARQQRRRVDELERQAAHAHREAREDDLTRLANRRAFEEELARRLAPAAAARPAPWLALVDLDGFKAVNDGLGHATGDLVLREVAAVLRSRTRGDDLLARIGGDEFALLLADADAERQREVCERLRLAVLEHGWPVVLAARRPIADAPTALRVSVSIGLTPSRPGDDPGSLLRRADSALYEAKRQGRNRVVMR